MVKEKDIKKIKSLIIGCFFCNNINHSAENDIELQAIKELVQGYWPSLQILAISNNIVIKIEIYH